MPRKTARRGRRALLATVGVVVLLGLWGADQLARAGVGPSWLQVLFGTSLPGTGLRAGVVAGHRGSDSGAVCPDGLTEAEINLNVAELVAEALRAEGIQVDVLDEFDPTLRGYRANALVSIHADSCAVPYSGFKVAPPEDGSPASRRLAECLWDRYEAVTGLPRHLDTITLDMTRYHAFREIASATPAAIIELGFMNADRELLTGQPERVALGVTAGVLCFLLPEK